MCSERRCHPSRCRCRCWRRRCRWCRHHRWRRGSISAHKHLNPCCPDVVHHELAGVPVVASPRPACIFIEDNVARDMDAPRHRVEHPVRLGARLITEQHHLLALVLQLAQMRPHIIHMRYTPERAQMVHRRLDVVPRLIRRLPGQALVGARLSRYTVVTTAPQNSVETPLTFRRLLAIATMV
jgi:hypothetical protein